MIYLYMHQVVSESEGEQHEEKHHARRHQWRPEKRAFMFPEFALE